MYEDNKYPEDPGYVGDGSKYQDEEYTEYGENLQVNQGNGDHFKRENFYSNEDEYEDYPTEEGYYENDGYEDEEEYYEDEDYEDEEYYDDYYDEDETLLELLRYRFEDLNPNLRKAIIGLILAIIVGAAIMLTGLGNRTGSLFSKKVKIPTMTALSMDNLPLDKDGNIIDPVYDKDGNLVGIPVHEDLQYMFGELYYGQTPEEEEEEIDLDEWEKEQTMQPGEEEEEGVVEEEPEDPTQYQVDVKDLPSSFYSDDPDNSKIKETNFRDLGVKPEHRSENNFIVYNWEGTLSPISREGNYVNREILGRVLDYEMFTEIMQYSVDVVGGRSSYRELPVSMSNNFNRELAMDKARKEYKKLEEEGVYKDLGLRTEDYAVNFIINVLDSNINSQDSASQFFIPEAEYDITEDQFQIFQHNLVEQIIKDINLLPNEELSNDYLGKVMFKIYNYVVEERLNYFKELGCEELNEFKKGLCSSPKDLNTLEIRSDFIQEVYSSALPIATEHYYYVMFRVYDRLNQVVDSPEIP